MAEPITSSRRQVEPGRWLWPVLLAGVIWVASGRSAVAAPGISHIDKVGHFMVFGLLATLVARALPGRAWPWAIVLTSFYGFLDEWHQSYTPGRAVEVGDWVADTTGAALAVILYVRWTWYRGWLERKIGRRDEARVDFGRESRPDGSES